ncbi:centromere protein H [Drosophila tropicalis]|uniref:centromere protein H n=1 Tax=Drosophila tropicalis TaxID=46794 RepID=UPI0035AB7BC3
MEKKQVQRQEVMMIFKGNPNTENNSENNNCENFVDSTSIESIESYLTSSLKNLRQQNKQLAEEYRQLQTSHDVKVHEKVKSLNKMNIQARSNKRTLLKQIQVRQLTVLHQMKWMIENESQIARAYDQHCKITMEKAEEQHNLEKIEGYDEFTNMSSDQLNDVIQACKEKLNENKAEARRLVLEIETEEAKHKVELMSLRNSVNSLEDVLRETSEVFKDLQFEKTLRDQSNTQM